MGKSSASCFRIIACGSDSVNQEGETLHERKSSGEGHGWSFRKKSGRNGMLSNTAVIEVPSSAEKKSPESTSASFQLQPNSTIPEKTTVVHITQEKKELPPEFGLSETIISSEDDKGTDATINQSSIIVIQTAIRKYSAQQVLLKQKNAIKLQAAVRGHLVRRHAVGTLRCIQAIVKMQTLVRKRQICLLGEGSRDVETGTSTVNPMLLRSAGSQPIGRSSSIEKLLGNKFAHQLMESTPRTNRINIKCDPSKYDSAWKWLERWMSTLSVIDERPQVSAIEPSDETPENDELITYDVCSYDSGPHTAQSNPTETKETPGIAKSETDKEDTASKYEELIPVATTSPNLTSLLVDSPGIELVKTSNSNDYASQAVRSECGTELSISSSLDSLDRPENGCTLRVEANDSSHILGTELSYININLLERYEGADSVSGECSNNNNMTADSSQLEETPEESSGSQNEGQATPSVQTPPEPVKSTGEICEAKCSTKRLLGSPSRSASEQLLKHNRISVPSYMQVTESARAKAISNGSPRLLLDGTNVRQGSPPIHQSPSQAQPNVKAYRIHSPKERKWRV